MSAPHTLIRPTMRVGGAYGIAAAVLVITAPSLPTDVASTVWVLGWLLLLPFLAAVSGGRRGPGRRPPGHRRSRVHRKQHGKVLAGARATARHRRCAVHRRHAALRGGAGRRRGHRTGRASAAP